MTAPLHRLAPGALAQVSPGDTVVIDGSEGHHAATVRRLVTGEEILVADGLGLMASGVVEEVSPGRVVVRVSTLTRRGQEGARFVLVQALAKGGRDEQALEAATELGVDGVVAWQAARSIVRWRGERAEKSLRKWESVAAAAAKQARRAAIPDVEGPANTRDVAARVRAAALALVLHEEAQTPLAGLALPPDGEILVIVGPEGGIGADELDEFVGAGAVAVRLGSTVLRSSSAGPAALAVLSAASRWR